jgi:hypothetical protein
MEPALAQVIGDLSVAVAEAGADATRRYGELVRKLAREGKLSETAHQELVKTAIANGKAAQLAAEVEAIARVNEIERLVPDLDRSLAGEAEHAANIHRWYGRGVADDGERAAALRAINLRDGQLRQRGSRLGADRERRTRLVRELADLHGKHPDVFAGEGAWREPVDPTGEVTARATPLAR